jgi:parallel beta-helix repeat protein
VEESEITKTAGSAVTVTSKGTAILRRNRIVSNDGVGIYVESGGTCDAEDNDLRGNHPAWYISSSAKVTRARNLE